MHAGAISGGKGYIGSGVQQGTMELIKSYLCSVFHAKKHFKTAGSVAVDRSVQTNALYEHRYTLISSPRKKNDKWQTKCTVDFRYLEH